MNATNRVINRGVLLIAGLVLAIGGLAALLIGARPAGAEAWLTGAEATATDLITRLGGAQVGGENPVPVALLVLLGLGLLLVIVCLTFLFTRGGGRTANVLRDDNPGGRTVVDRNVADAFLSGALADRKDVLSTRAAAYRIHRVPAIALTVTVRRGAPLGAVLAAAEDAVQEWAALLGRKTPVLVHLTDPRLRDSLKSRTRVR